MGSACTGCKHPGASLDMGNSGTAMRLFTGLLAGQDFDSTLIGDESLSRRPMERVAEPLRLMGARIETTRWPAAVAGLRRAAPQRNSLRHADGERPGEIGGAAGGTVCLR